MKNNRGFTITETLVSLAILIIISTAVLPLSSFVSQERQALSQKRIITHKLHDELQSVLHLDLIPKELKSTVESTNVTFHFNKVENNLIVGCASWKSITSREEEVCFYGIPEK